MNRKNYQKPISLTFELSAEQMIASSGDAHGTIDKMPWNSNRKESPIWEKSESASVMGSWK